MNTSFARCERYEWKLISIHYRSRLNELRLDTQNCNFKLTLIKLNIKTVCIWKGPDDRRKRAPLARTRTRISARVAVHRAIAIAGAVTRTEFKSCAMSPGAGTVQRNSCCTLYTVCTQCRVLVNGRYISYVMSQNEGSVCADSLYIGVHPATPCLTIWLLVKLPPCTDPCILWIAICSVVKLSSCTLLL